MVVVVMAIVRLYNTCLLGLGRFFIIIHDNQKSKIVRVCGGSFLLYN
jgi:hypothetical protein